MASVVQPSFIRRPGSTRSSPSTKSVTTLPPALPRPIQSMSLPRRLLFPHLPPTVPLPRLLLDPDAPQELDDAFYDFIALALRAFVHPWWSKLTRYDRDLLPQVTRILIQVIQALEARVGVADLTALLCRDLPFLLQQHYVDYRNVMGKQLSAYAGGGATTPSQLFHQTQAHMAVNADGTIEEEYFRQVIDHVLHVCLPEEDFEPETERFIIREIILMVIVRSVIPKVTQPWFIQQMIANLIAPNSSSVSSQVKSTSALRSVTFNSFVIFLLSAVQSISGACLALINTYKNARETVKAVNVSHSRNVLPASISRLTRFSEEDSRLPTPPLSPPRTPPIRSPSLLSVQSYTSPETTPTIRPIINTTPPDYVQPSILFLSELLMLHRRHASVVLLNIITFLVAAFRSFLSQYVPYVLHQSALSYDCVVMIVQSSTRALFPDGWPAPAPPDPTPEEQVIIRETLITRLAAIIPAPIKVVLIGPDEKVALNNAIDPLSSKEANVHLVVLVIDAIVLTLFPELGVGGTAQTTL